MKYFSPSTGRTVTSGELSALSGRPPSAQQLAELGYVELVDPYANFSLADQMFTSTGNARGGDYFYETYTLNTAIAEALQGVITYHQGLVGNIAFFVQSIAPSGFLICDGSVYNIEDYLALANVLGDAYGGDGITTFAVPDLRGQFVRGWDEAGGTPAGVDPDRVLGSSQGDAFGSHSHIMAGNLGATGSRIVAGTTGKTPDYTSGAPTDFTGDTETRPKNVAFLPCIFSGVYTTPVPPSGGGGSVAE
jgi:microcystin-dependent protein